MESGKSHQLTFPTKNSSKLTTQDGGTKGQQYQNFKVYFYGYIPVTQ